MIGAHSDELRSGFRLGDRLVTPCANDLAGVRIDTKCMEVLVTLAQAAPGVVSTAALLERVWRDVIVVENVIYQAIAQLRRALGDSAREPRYIESISRRGYRLIADVIYGTG